MKLRKLLAAALSLTMVCTAAVSAGYAPLSAFAEDGTSPITEVPETPVSIDPVAEEIGNITYKIYTDHAVLYQASGSLEGEVIVPSEVNELPVTEIATGAFGFCDDITSIVIPASVTMLGTSLFTYCHGLENVAVDPANPNYCSINGVVYTKDKKTVWAFPPAHPEKDFTLADTTETISDHSLYTAEIESLTLPDSVKTIDRFGMTYLKFLKSIKLSDNLESIGSHAFSNCRVLESVDIPASVKEIGSGAFMECDALAVVTVNNPDCVIKNEDRTLGVKGTTVVRGYAGSTAQAYAEKYGYTFALIGDQIPVVTTTASGETTTTTTTTTTTITTTTTTTTGSAAVTTTTSTGIPSKLKYIYYIRFLDPDTNASIQGVQFTIKTNDDEDEDFGIVTAENGIVTLRGYGDRFTLTIVGLPEGYQPADPPSFTTENIKELTPTIYIAKDGTVSIKDREASTTTTDTTPAVTTTTSSNAPVRTTTTIAALVTSTASESATSTTSDVTTTTSATTTATTATTPEVTSEPTLAEKAVGKWEFSYFTNTNGEVVDQFGNTSAVVEFNSDGTGKYTVNSSDVQSEGDSFTWTVDGDTVTAVLDNPITEANGLFFKYTDGELIFDRTDGKIHFVKEGSPSLGDANSDGSIDAKDASFILAAYSKASTGGDDGLTDAQKTAADVNTDGKVDAKDASAILAYYSYLSTGGDKSLIDFLA